MASWAVQAMRSAAMDISSIVSSCEVRIYRVSQVALHEANGGRHGVVCDVSDGAPDGTTYRARLLVMVCECDHGERVKPGTIERKPSWRRVPRKVLDRCAEDGRSDSESAGVQRNLRYQCCVSASQLGNARHGTLKCLNDS